MHHITCWMSRANYGSFVTNPNVRWASSRHGLIQTPDGATGQEFNSRKKAMWNISSGIYQEWWLYSTPLHPQWPLWISGKWEEKDFLKLWKLFIKHQLFSSCIQTRRNAALTVPLLLLSIKGNHICLVRSDSDLFQNKLSCFKNLQSHSLKSFMYKLLLFTVFVMQCECNIFTVHKSLVVSGYLL